MKRQVVSLATGVERWSQIVRHHRPEQLARRLWYRVRERFDAAERDDFAEPPSVRFAPTHASRSVDESQVALAAALARGTVVLLNQPVFVGRPISWTNVREPSLSPLAAFHLHYHQYLLAAVDVDPVPVWEALAGWLDAFPAPTRASASRTAWHPYCLSRRIPVWMDLLQRRPPARLAERMIDSLARQARRLAARFERDLGGNHLWENAKALLAVGCYFDGAEAAYWRRQGWATLADCFATQLLPSGEHEERSPMYQVDLARGLEWLCRWLEPVDVNAGRICRQAAARMHTFADAIRHPDGGLPLFGDTALDHDLPTPPRGFASGWVGDYCVERTADRHALIFDTGDLGPDHLPAHAHADLLGFELSAFGRRLFVDSGVCEYSGPHRLPLRRSAAHNVLVVDDIDHADVWSNFRMGRRGRIAARRAGVVGAARWVGAEHDAYRRFGVRVLRFFVIVPGGPWWSVHVVFGRGERRAVEHLHLHPDVGIAQIDERSAIVQVGDRRAYWRTAGQTEWRQATGEYSDRFNVVRPNAHWTLEPAAELPAVSAWALTFDAPLTDATARLKNGRLLLAWNGQAASGELAIPLE